MEKIHSVAREEVLRYLGYRGQELSADLITELDFCEKQLLNAAIPTFLYRVFDRVEEGDGVGLSGCKLVLPGADIQNHLAGCSRVVLFAATLSSSVDRLIASARVTGVTRALILDAAADALIEQVCDAAEREIRAENEKMYATWRFSPGYGDLPIELQNQILTVLDAPRRIGLCATDASLLTPRKSVTAVIGFSETELPKKQRGCETCSAYDACIYRKRGDRCVR